jgi:hypothetical protein
MTTTMSNLLTLAFVAGSRTFESPAIILQSDEGGCSYTAAAVTWLLFLSFKNKPYEQLCIVKVRLALVTCLELNFLLISINAGDDLFTGRIKHHVGDGNNHTNHHHQRPQPTAVICYLSNYGGGLLYPKMC